MFYVYYSRSSVATNKIDMRIIRVKGRLGFFFNVLEVTNTTDSTVAGTAKGVVVSCYKADQHKFMWVVSWELIQKEL